MNDVRYWHKAHITTAPMFVRFWTKADITLIDVQQESIRCRRQKADMSLCAAPVRFWPKADITWCTAHVRFWGVKRTLRQFGTFQGTSLNRYDELS